MLSFEEYQKMGRKAEEEKKARQEYLSNIHNEKLKTIGINPSLQNSNKPKYDHPSTPDDSLVTILYIAAMAVSMLFKGFVVLWIVLTLLYVNFISRHDND